jgi:DNA end-binding protein Ku
VARSMWSGAISFGLLNIPVSLTSAKETDASIDFNLLDKRDNGRIGYKQYNKTTGKEVNKKDIVKGYEYEPDHFVIMTDKDFERANPKATHTIDIEDFVNLEELDPLMFEKPYYLMPSKFGEKGYVLLRNVMDKTKKVAIGQIVLHKKQRLVAIMSRGDYLICEVLRYAREVIQTKGMEKLDKKIKEIALSKKELDMATHLVDGMTAKWDPEKYEDTYHDDLLKRIKLKVKHGGVIAEEPEAEKEPQNKGVIDLMPLLKRSLDAAGPHKKTTKKKAVSHHRKAKRA